MNYETFRKAIGTQYDTIKLWNDFKKFKCDCEEEKFESWMEQCDLVGARINNWR